MKHSLIVHSRARDLNRIFYIETAGPWCSAFFMLNPNYFKQERRLRPF